MLDIRIGPAQSSDYLTLFPLLAPEDTELPYALLAEAIAGGVLTIGEVGQGTVPALLAHNAGDTDILVLDGEQLIGSKQNRMTNRSILLPARSTVQIPVSCMEHGRWRFDTQAMSSAPQHSPAKIRRKARETEAMHVRAGAVASDAVLYQAQGAVWEAIAETEDRLGAHSATGKMDHLYDATRGRLDELERAFPAIQGQVGLLAFAGGTPIGMDVVGGRTLYSRLHARLLRGYLLDALDRATMRPSGDVVSAEEAAVQRYLDSVRAARRVASPTVGKGTYAVLAGAVIGGELLDGDAVAHLSAFPTDERTGGLEDPPFGEAPLPRPSQRKRHRPGPM